MTRSDIHTNNGFAILMPSVLLATAGTMLGGGIVGLIFFILPALVIAWVLYRGYPNGAPDYNLVLLRDGKFYDVGPGPIHLGYYKWTHRLTVYRQRKETVEKEIVIQTKDGRFVTAMLRYVWQPDPDNLPAYFANQDSKVYDTFITSWIQLSAKQMSARDLFGAKFPDEITDSVEGFLIGKPMLYNIADARGDLSGHMRDTSHLIESVIDEVESEAALEATAEYLAKLHPDRTDRIRRLVGNKQAKLRKSGM